MFFFTWFSGLDHKNLGILGCCLVTLWCLLGLVFWGKLNIALTLRQKNYFAVGRRWNGDFEKNRAELEVPWVGGLFTPEHSTGYPDIPLGCPFESNGIDLALPETPDADTTLPIRCADEHWSVPPWMRLNANVAAILTECAKLNPDSESYEELEYPDQTSLYNPTCIESFNPATGLTTCTPANICVSAGVPVGTFAPPPAAAAAGGAGR